jgi:hypothetical protein
MSGSQETALGSEPVEPNGDWVGLKLVANVADGAPLPIAGILECKGPSNLVFKILHKQD